MRTIYYLTFALAFISSASLIAQIQLLNGKEAAAIFEGAEVLRYDEDQEIPLYLSFEEGMQPSKTEFFDMMKKELALSENVSFELLSSSTDSKGYLHERYHQFFGDKEIAYTHLNVHSKNGKVISFNGNFTALRPSNRQFSLDSEAALEKAINYVSANEYYGNPEEFYNYGKNRSNGDLSYLPNSVFSEEGGLLLCYKFNIYAKDPMSRTLLFIDANSGKVVFNESLIHTGNSKGTAITAYSDTKEIITDSLSPTSFRLRDSSRGNGVETYNALQTRNYSAAVDFTDSNNVWNNVNANLDQYATDAHWGTQQFYDYLKDVFQRNSIDDSAFTLKSYVHVDQNLVNAFWDGERMSYGDGNQTNGPLTTLDIVGHEIAHGLTEFTSGLIYANESGALNESYSDIFGSTLEFFARPSRANWTVGEDIGGAFRSMSNPKQYGNPDTYDGQFWTDQDCIPTRNNDRCGVHNNSGVQNKWFYLLSQGGAGVNDLSDTFQLNGIGILKAEQIAFRTLTVYLTPSSNFSDARFYSIISAADLYGACSPEVEQTTDAWYAVGVGKPYKNGVSADFVAEVDTSFCFFPADVQFRSQGNNVLQYNWIFGNGDSSSARNPEIHFDSLGNYDVTLIADGGACGSDTIVRSDYIILDTSLSCAYFLRDTINPVVSECNGKLFDSGGLNGFHSTNESGIFTLDIPAADYIELDFIKMDIEAGDGFSCNRDYVEVFDGPNIASKSLGRFCKNHLPANNLLNSSSNQLTIQFISDRILPTTGFFIEWSCKTATQAPSVDFDVQPDSTCDGLVKFTNRSQGGMQSVFWDFGNGYTHTLKDPLHDYKINGDYSVKLVVENSQGRDSIVKNMVVNVNRPPNPIAQSDTFCLRETGGLKVASNERVAWYRDTNATAVFFGDSITLFNLRKDTTLFVKEIYTNSSVNGGKMLNSGAGEYSNDNDYLVFDVHKPIVLESILFFPNRSGSRTIDIRNHDGDIVVSRSVFIPSSPLLVTLNFEIPPDTSYRISISDREAGLYKNTAGASFPYNISNLVTIKRSNLPADHYPYFYRWKVTEQACETNFKQISAIVDTSCVITGINETNNAQAAEFSVYPNPVNQQLRVDFSDKFKENSLDIEIYSTQGQLIYRTFNYKVGNGSLNIDMGAFSNGVYYLRMIGDQMLESRKIIKTD